MSGMGKKHKIWTKELDDKLLAEIEKGDSSVELEVSMGVCELTIRKRLREMGFDGLVDARAVLTNY